MNSIKFNGCFLENNYEDSAVFSAIEKEWERQENQIELIASENFVSKDVLSAIGSVCTNKYAEGYPRKRYYGGCEFIDDIEEIAIQRACKLFNCKFANVQPHSGSQANFAVYYSLLTPGDTILGMDLSSGGHLTHGSKVSVSGKWFNAITYGVNDDGYIDYSAVENLALEHKPKLIVCGASAYPRKIDFEMFRKIADNVGAYLIADIAHYAGLIASKLYPTPFPYADVVTSTTHKTLRGPRGGIILTNKEELVKKINSAIFPGIQGGPHMHTIAGKAVAFGEALNSNFVAYSEQVIKNAKVLSDVLIENGINVLSGGTDCHMLIADLRNINVSGKDAESWLDAAGITCNKNSVPNDPQPPMKTSGIRLGTPAMTTRGLKETEFRIIGVLITEVLQSEESERENIIKSVREKTLELCNRFPLYK